MSKDSEIKDNQNFDRWNNKKKLLNVSVFTDFVHEREVWWCSLGINLGVEANGKHENFERPVIVLRKFSQDAVLVVCVTSRVKKDNPYHIVYTHNGEEFSAVISQTRLISTKRLVRKLFTMSSGNFKRIRDGVADLVINKRPPLARGSRRPHGR